MLHVNIADVDVVHISAIRLRVDYTLENVKIVMAGGIPVIILQKSMGWINYLLLNNLYTNSRYYLQLGGNNGY